MQIITSRFGPLRIDDEDVLDFPAGVYGLEDCRRWVLLADDENPAVCWLQSVERPEVALALASPRRFVPDYQARIARRELAELCASDLKEAELLVVVGRSGEGLTLNLKAPVVIDPERRLGRQVVVNGQFPVSYPLRRQSAALKRTG
jgi:flagellar assembly factor FliW